MVFYCAVIFYFLVFSWRILVIPQTPGKYRASFPWWYEPFADRFINRVVDRNLIPAEEKLAKGSGETLRTVLIDKPKEEREAELLGDYEILDFRERPLEFANFQNLENKNLTLRIQIFFFRAIRERWPFVKKEKVEAAIRACDTPE